MGPETAALPRVSKALNKETVHIPKPYKDSYVSSIKGFWKLLVEAVKPYLGGFGDGRPSDLPASRLARSCGLVNSNHHIDTQVTDKPEEHGSQT